MTFMFLLNKWRICMVHIINGLAFTWGTFWTIKAGRAILCGKSSSINFIMLVFYVFFILPLGFDIILGIPNYTYERSFIIATHDVQTCIIYSLYVSFVPVIWAYTAIHKNRASVMNHDKEKKMANKKLVIFMYMIGLVSPLILVFFAPNPEIYVQYGRAVLGFPTTQSESYHSLVGTATILSVISYSFLIIEMNRKLIKVLPLLLSPLLLIAIWVDGKRNIVVLAVVLIVYAIWKRKVLKPFQLGMIVVIFSIFFFLFSSIYQQTFRYETLGVDNWKEVYQNMRVDFGRDDVTKMAIFAELHPEQLQILDYRFQSFLFNTFIYIPRDIWPEKPWPYAVYATSALLMIPPQYVGWSMTTKYFR